MEKQDIEVTDTSEGIVSKNVHISKSLNDRLQDCAYGVSKKKGRAVSQRDIFIIGLEMVLKKFGY